MTIAKTPTFGRVLLDSFHRGEAFEIQCWRGVVRLRFGTKVFRILPENIDYFCDTLQKAKTEALNQKNEIPKPKKDWVKNQQEAAPWVGEENRSEVTRIPFVDPPQTIGHALDWITNQKKAAPNIRVSNERP